MLQILKKSASSSKVQLYSWSSWEILIAIQHPEMLIAIQHPEIGLPPPARENKEHEPEAQRAEVFTVGGLEAA